MIRLILGGLVILFAAIIAPAAADPVPNTADLLVFLAPFALVALYLAPSENDSLVDDIDDEHPEAHTRLDDLQRDGSSPR